MAKSPKPDKPPSRTIYGIGFLRAPGGNIVAVRGLMDLSACESISPRRVDSDMETRPMAHETEPDNMGNVFRVVRPTMVKVGSHPVHGQRSDRSMRKAIEALGVQLNRAIHGEPESIEALEALVPPPKPPKQHRQETAKDKRIRAERAMGFLGRSDAYVRDALLKAGRTVEQAEKYIRERAA